MRVAAERVVASSPVASSPPVANDGAVRDPAAAANALVPGQGELDPADAGRMLPRITVERVA